VGKKVFGGGAVVVTEGAGPFLVDLLESAPGTIGGGGVGQEQDLWVASVRNEDTIAHTVGWFVVCAFASP
jgi:hypothetical protein